MDLVTDIRVEWVLFGFWGCVLLRLDEACECGYTSGCAVLCERGTRNSRESGLTARSVSISELRL